MLVRSSAIIATYFAAVGSAIIATYFAAVGSAIIATYFAAVGSAIIPTYFATVLTSYVSIWAWHDLSPDWSTNFCAIANIQSVEC